MRGQRPALAGLWAWLAVLAMVFAGVPALQMRSAQADAITTVQIPGEERGGEGSGHETAPAKLRRNAPPPSLAEPALPPSAAVIEPWLEAFPLLATAPVLRQDWPRVAAQTSWAERRGRRVQRGQAPPLA